MLLEGGQKLAAKMVVLADGVHSKTATEHHTARLDYQNRIGWRYAVAACPAQTRMQQLTSSQLAGVESTIYSTSLPCLIRTRY